MSAPLLAVDLGGTKLAVALVTPDGEIASRVKVPVRKESFAASNEVASVGVSVPGIYCARTGNAWTGPRTCGDGTSCRCAMRSRRGPARSAGSR